MTSFEQYPESSFLYLRRADVIAAANGIDLIGAVSQALVWHSEGKTVLPDEAYLGWRTPAGHSARCLAMPGALTGGDEPVVGLKTINASLGNPAAGLPRSQGFTVLLDPETAAPRALMEAAYLSAMRTAAVSVLSVRALSRPDPEVLSIIGCGTLARAHLRLLLPDQPTLRSVKLFDADPARALALADEWAGETAKVEVSATAEACVEGADVVVPVTTTTEGYLERGWLADGALVVHVSLDDLRPEAVLGADLIVVDDWNLVRDDPRRLLGRLYRQGALRGPDGEGVDERVTGRKVDATLSDVLTGRHPGRTSVHDLVVVNPFGMAILDVAVADRVWAHARSRGLGSVLSN